MDSSENLNMKENIKPQTNPSKLCQTQATEASDTEVSSKEFSVDKSLSPLICRRLKFVRYNLRNSEEDLKLSNKAISKRQKLS
ncbi:unnamed protein product [Blepharisma stoltei]|uniref:Uncharacterized protein n=1 Tax=Blepharisma stoltei TaxID=1481888 RepID=A0AAU9K1J0_9CILI|nr:unnamed protein product [Blepharisma stoltei]